MSNVAHLPIEADRYGACVRQIYIRGLDLTGVAMRAQVRLTGDTPGDPLVDLLTVTNGNAEGLRLVGVETVDELPVSHVELVINETTMERLPYAGELGSPTELRWDWQVTLAGRKQRIAKGEFVITGDGVTGADNAPANRPQAWSRSFSPTAGMRTGATLTFGDETIEVSVDGANLVAAEVVRAVTAQDRAEAAQQRADVSAGAAQGAARYFTTRAAGEAASSVDQAFSTDDGAGGVIYYRRTSGGSAEIGRALTPGSLSGATGASLVGRKALGTGAVTRRLDATLDESGALVSDYKQDGDGTDWTPAFGRAFDYLSSTRTAHPHFQPWGVGTIKVGRGTFPLAQPLYFSQSQVGFGITGQARFATVFSKNITTGHAFFLNPSGYSNFEDFTIVNDAATRGDSAAFAILGTNGGHMTTIQRLNISNFALGVSVSGTTNGDFTHIVDSEFDTDTGYTNNSNKNAVGAMLDNVSHSCRTALVSLGGSGEVSINGGGGNVHRSVVHYREGAGVANIYPQSALLHHHKLEYGGATGPDNAQLLIDGRDTVLGPNSGGADTVTIFRDVTYTLGDTPPGDPSGTAYDDHRIIDIAGGRHRVHMIAGYLRGAIRYLSDYAEDRARWLIRGMRAAPLPSRLLLGGTGTHPLIRWHDNENVADQYRGGTSGIRVIQRGPAVLWRQLQDQVINTGVSQTAFPQSGGGNRYGAEFTIDLTLQPLDLPPLITIEGLALYVENNVYTTDTKVEWFSDNFSTLIDSATISGGVRGKVTISTKETTVVDGKIRVRITKPGTGDNGTVGALVIPYFPFFGRN